MDLEEKYWMILWETRLTGHKDFSRLGFIASKDIMVKGVSNENARIRF